MRDERFLENLIKFNFVPIFNGTLMFTFKYPLNILFGNG